MITLFLKTEIALLGYTVDFFAMILRLSSSLEVPSANANKKGITHDVMPLDTLWWR